MLSAKTAVCDGQIPDEIVGMILLPAGSRQSQQEAISRAQKSLQQEVRDRGPSQQKPNMSYSFSRTLAVCKCFISTKDAMYRIY